MALAYFALQQSDGLDVRNICGSLYDRDKLTDAFRIERTVAISAASRAAHGHHGGMERQ